MPLAVQLLVEGGEPEGLAPAAAPAVAATQPPETTAPKPRVPATRAARTRAPTERAPSAPAVASSPAGVIGPPSGIDPAAEPVEVAAVAPVGEGTGGRRLYAEGEVDGVATPRQRVLPRYPERARLLGREADVRVAVTVEADGAVSEVAVLASGGEEFDREATSAIRRESWAPARRGGEAVAAVVTFTVRFRLGD